jgi:hypothetical protein
VACEATTVYATDSAEWIQCFGGDMNAESAVEIALLFAVMGIIMVIQDGGLFI